jgi:hypothetical protein
MDPRDAFWCLCCYKPGELGIPLGRIMARGTTRAFGTCDCGLHLSRSRTLTSLGERKLRAALSSLLAVSPESFQDWEELPGKPDPAVAFW